MLKQNYISFLFYGLLAVLLTLAPTIANVSTAGHSSTVQKLESQEKGTEDESTYLSEVSLDVIIPSHAFSFAGPVLFCVISQSNFEFKSCEAPWPAYSNGYAFRYFDKVFEHAIAVNAP